MRLRIKAADLKTLGTIVRPVSKRDPNTDTIVVLAQIKQTYMDAITADVDGLIEMAKAIGNSATPEQALAAQESVKDQLCSKILHCPRKALDLLIEYVKAGAGDGLNW